MNNHTFTELNDCWYFSYDHKKPLKEQVLTDSRSGFILCANKIYTNNVYFGIEWFELDTSNKSIFHWTKCKDRGFTEDVVKSKKSLIWLLKRYDYINKSDIGYEFKLTDFTSEKQEFPDLDFDVYFVYELDTYKHTIISFNNTNFKGCYKIIPTTNELLHLKHKADISQSNVITTENIAYSSIKAIHKSNI